MVSDIRNRSQVEHFLRNASAEELMEQRSLIQNMPALTGEAERLVARIAYELRFRLPQPV